MDIKELNSILVYCKVNDLFHIEYVSAIGELQPNLQESMQLYCHRLKQHIKCNLLNLKEFGLNEDFIEAQLIGFLTVRSINKLPITFPKTTGVKKPLTGGKIYIPTKNH